MKNISFTSKTILNALLVLGFSGLLLSGNSALAQNTGGVFPPMVNDGHKSAQYRIAYNPDTERFNQRLHYQQSINDDLMWRIIGQTRKTTDSDFDFDYIQGELFWELSDSDDKHKTGVRFDARLRDDNRPHILGFNAMRQYNFEDGWTLRTVGLSSLQIGDNAADGVGLQTRFQLGKRLDSGHGLGLELYNNYGNSQSFGSFNTQNHTFGPYYSMPIQSGWSLYGGPLIGLSDGAPDGEFRLWITKSL